MKFTKMQGLGNDYIYINCFEQTIQDPNSLSKRLSNRHFGIGGDGIVLIMPSEAADFRMRMFNADASEGKMCGNASRCIGKYVYDKGLTDKTEITLETLSGIKTLKLNVIDGKVSTVSVDMGSPEIGVVGGSLIANDNQYVYTDVSMGNPHCVIFCNEDVNTLDLPTIGVPIENHSNFPDRTNVEFVNVIDEKTLKMRVWERGSGETLACGTGACASVVAAVVNGYCKSGTDVTVQLLGGNLKINYNDNVLMDGPAEFVFEGEIEDEN